MNLRETVRFIFSIGCGIFITTAVGSFLCVNMYPIAQTLCAKANQDVIAFLTQMGYLPYLVGTVGGSTIYYITGKWNRN